MSTRCHVAFYEKESTKKTDIYKFNVCLYFHSDGYPSGILPSLVPFLKAFNQERGLKDTSYAAAWCMAWMIKDKYVFNSLEEMDCLGNGIVEQGMSFQSDIEYLYEVHPDKLFVKSVRCNLAKGRFRFRTIGTIDLLSTDDLKTQLEMAVIKD